MRQPQVPPAADRLDPSLRAAGQVGGHSFRNGGAPASGALRSAGAESVHLDAGRPAERRSAPARAASHSTASASLWGTERRCHPAASGGSREPRDHRPTKRLCSSSHPQPPAALLSHGSHGAPWERTPKSAAAAGRGPSPCSSMGGAPEEAGPPAGNVSGQASAAAQPARGAASGASAPPSRSNPGAALRPGRRPSRASVCLLSSGHAGVPAPAGARRAADESERGRGVAGGVSVAGADGRSGRDRARAAGGQPCRPNDASASLPDRVLLKVGLPVHPPVISIYHNV
jgi:hypothetical protein